MSRRGKGRAEGGAGAGGLEPVYEGPEVLTALLRGAGSQHDAQSVARAFARAQSEGTERGAVIPGFFSAEPRFESPEAARRLYGNLFGLWERVASGQGAEDDAPSIPQASAERARVELPERGTTPGNELPLDVVEAVWTHLASAPHPDVVRRRDRFRNAQPDLVAWLDASEMSDAAAMAVMDLAFEAWAMFDQAFGDRLRTVEYRELRALEDAPPALDDEQPAFASYVREQLELLVDEDPAFDPGARAEVERIAAIVAGALGRAVQLHS